MLRTVAGVFDFETGLRLVKFRGEAMQEAAEVVWEGSFWEGMGGRCVWGELGRCVFFWLGVGRD